MSDLVDRLSKGAHPISATRYKSRNEFEEAIDRGFVLIKFTGTRGGTELGFRIDSEKSSIDSSNGSGKRQLVGPLTLDYVTVECAVEIDMETLEGIGSLRKIGGRGGAETPTESKAPPKTKTQAKQKARGESKVQSKKSKARRAKVKASLASDD